MGSLTKLNLEAFVASRPVAAVHFDAAWDITWSAVMRRKMEGAKSVFGEQVAIGYVDCDESPELAKAIAILNVPTVAYYCNGRFVAAVIGAEQDIARRLERLVHGDVAPAEP